MPGGGSTQPTQTTKAEMSNEQKQLYDMAMPGLKDFAATVPQRYQGGSGIADFNPAQLEGQTMALDAAQKQKGVSDAATQQMPFFFNDIWKPESNPALTGAIDATVRPIQNNLTQSTLPAIRSEMGMTGMGGSRAGIAEGLAVQGAQQATGDASAKLVNNLYDTNINAQLKAFGLLPTVQQSQVTPAATTSAVGDVQQAHDQALLNEHIGNFNYDQYAPFLQSKELLSLLTGIPGGTTTSTGNNPSGTPTAMSALGGAASGAALGSMLMPGIGTGLGAAGGALLPFLFK